MLKWFAVFDPNETKDYYRDWTAEMDAINDTIETVIFSVTTPDSGLAVQDQAVAATQKIAVVWFTAYDVDKLTAKAGKYITIDHTITTIGGRVYNETLGLKIKEK